MVCLSEAGHTGRGECQPNPRFEESADGVVRQLDAVLRAGIVQESCDTGDPAAWVQPAGLEALSPAAANALDCAWLDLKARLSGRPVWRILGLPQPQALQTTITLSMDTPDAMARAAEDAANLGARHLKLKIGHGALDTDIACVAAVAERAKDASLIVDANEAWRPDWLATGIAALEDLGVRLLEQPLPADGDEALASTPRRIPIIADEAVTKGSGLALLSRRYDGINIKLDKVGGLRAGLALAQKAKAQGLQVMVGCMLGTSLAMAPAILLAQGSEWCDLDGAWLLAKDRPGARGLDASFRIQPVCGTLWGN